VRVRIVDGDADFADTLGDQLADCADLMVVDSRLAADVMVIRCRQPRQLQEIDYAALHRSHPEMAIVLLTGQFEEALSPLLQAGAAGHLCTWELASDVPAAIRYAKSELARGVRAPLFVLRARWA
jgi:hypothetical protein